MGNASAEFKVKWQTRLAKAEGRIEQARSVLVTCCQEVLSASLEKSWVAIIAVFSLTELAARDAKLVECGTALNSYLRLTAEIDVEKIGLSGSCKDDDTNLEFLQASLETTKTFANSLVVVLHVEGQNA
jgi:hypothetical protein